MSKPMQAPFVAFNLKLFAAEWPGSATLKPELGNVFHLHVLREISVQASNPN